MQDGAPTRLASARSLIPTTGTVSRGAVPVSPFLLLALSAFRVVPNQTALFSYLKLLYITSIPFKIHSDYAPAGEPR